ncbi:DUF72 domain-containing protein [Paenibacillus rigui]|uniref:DUF72 domain-containing protein n=1 Tax=Paenibacillus rigui TaxID=554312 RepID=A0A229UJI6_9BACL|nr:DUF72 domain-containing protein [Paenibacillus rigui]OXM83552.1 hypothetical protein CF651_24895 [Paenibacillus rigui]
MIRIGLAGWGDHDDLYMNGVPQRDKLRAYSQHFNVVEVDSSFYAVPAPATFERWVRETPDDFQFVVKAYQGMTGHLRGRSPFADSASMFQAFRDSVQPVMEAGKLQSVLFQYPPWFNCTREHVALLRDAKDAMKGLPVALEFRHQSWFTPQLRERTLSFLEKEGWFHSICDEPQAGDGSVPTVLKATHPEQTVVRMHGRNAAGWNSGGQPNWRDVRYLYRYSEAELAEWAERLRLLERETANIAVIFNNNSGGDAAGNAKQLMRMLGIEYEGTEPRQLDLF